MTPALARHRLGGQEPNGGRSAISTRPKTGRCGER